MPADKLSLSVSYYKGRNEAGGGSHVCNCGYVTSARNRRGVARAMCSHSLEQARAGGYNARQFNSAVSTNERAVRLWKSLGFRIVGRLPGAFQHPILGFVDACVMFQEL
jgi:ribosomal protein S18 acetylase RimI-like enzyme